MRYHVRLKLVRFTKRVTFGLVATVALLVAIRLVWGWEASRRLAAAWERVSTMQLQLDPQQFRGSPIPDNENAAVALREAFRSQRIDFPEVNRRGDGRFFGFGRMFGMMNPQRVHRMIEDNAVAIGWIDQAGKRSRAEWEFSEQGAPQEFNGEQIYGALFDMQGLLRGAANISHQEGDDVLAIRYLERMLTVARTLEAQPSLSSQQFANTIRSEAALMIDGWGPDMHFSGESVAASKGLMSEFLHEAEYTDKIVRTFQFETGTYQDDVLASFPSLREWWIRPLAMDAFARRLSLQQELLPVAKATNWQQVAAVSLATQAERSNLANIVFTFSAPRLLVVDTMRARFHAMSDGRASAMLLGAYLYKHEKGRFPGSAEMLMPESFAAVPVDPFATDGRALRYRLDADGPTVWSVGENGKDEGGDMGMASPMMYGGGGGRRYSQPDIVYGAAWRAAATMPAR